MSFACLKSGFSVGKAHKAQLRLSKLIVFEDRLPREIRYVAGVDTAYVGDLAISAAVVLDFKNLTLLKLKQPFAKSPSPMFQHFSRLESCPLQLHVLRS